MSPLLAWSAYALGLYIMMYCMSVALRKQWVENERIAFPLVQLPAEMMKGGGDNSSLGSFFKSRGMWIGFTVAAFASFVIFMYHRFLWWPLHPIGCVTGSSWGVKMMLFSIFLGWFLKYIILRYGGLRGHRMARPLFLGLIFGEYFVGGVWLIVGLFTGRGYRILP